MLTDKSIDNNCTAHFNLGNAFRIEGKYDVAAAHYAEAVRLYPTSELAHENLGVALYMQGKLDAAQTHFIEALRLNPSYDEAHNNLGMILARDGKYSEAIAHFTEAIRLNPEDAEAHYNLGLVRSRLGNYEPAKSHFAEAIRLDPNDPKAYNASAMIMAACPDAKSRDADRAIEFAGRACELTHWKNPTILDTLAAAQAEAGNFDTAVSSQKKAIELLKDQREKDDYRTRLALYRAKKPYRQASPKHDQRGASQ